jgi:uncharacterized protein (TIGR02271 family)
MIVGIFRDHALADQAVSELRHAGFRGDQIRFAGQGPVAGGLLDHVASTLAGRDNANGRLANQLVSNGVPADEADYYQHELDAGRTIVMVESYGHQQEARNILYRYGAYDATSRATQEEGERVIPLREEELHIRKQLVQTGEVVIHKKVITEEKTFTVPVTREELIIERRSVTDQASPQPARESDTLEEVLKDGGTFRIVLREEQVKIEKYPVEREEIVISKRQIQETKHFSETLKREEAHFERTGNVNIQGDEDILREHGS